MANRILGIPTDEKYDYEFMVVIAREDGDFDFHSNHETAIAFKVAEDVGGVVCHNVRISRKQLKKHDDIAEECHSWVFGTPLDDIVWYLQEHRDEMDEWAECFKKSFCEMIDTIKKELQENE